MLALRIVVLVILLNIIRYLVGGIIEGALILPHLFGQMEAEASYFRMNFQTIDWVTSFFYNFMVWLSIVWVFYLARPNLRGSDVVRSLKVFGIMWIFFTSLSAVYMNHYSHSKLFYFWNILDAAVVFPIVAVANGLLYLRIVGAAPDEEKGKVI